MSDIPSMLPNPSPPGATPKTAGELLTQLRRETIAAGESRARGDRFEKLVTRFLKQQPEFEVAQIWRWADWPQRAALTGLDGTDIGIDLVAVLTSGAHVAVQCKCYAENARVGTDEISRFLAVAQQHETFRLKWLVATCPWTVNAEKLLGAGVRRIDFLEYRDVIIETADGAGPKHRDPWPLQEKAIRDAVEGLGNHDRGRLVMACGTGKTFTALRIAERVVEDGGRILFLAPSIALVSQARREWLRYTMRRVPLACTVICSDSTAGRNNVGATDIGLSELECPVTTDPATIATALKPRDDRTRVVFCTYQSLLQVTRAQAEHGAPPFNLVIADEAHRTTGVRRANGEAGFRLVHDDNALAAHKRLYMTATPRIYTAASKRRLHKRHIEVVDMSDTNIYGPEFHRLSFKDGVEKGMLSDYRVIVLGVHETTVPLGLRSRLVALGEPDAAGRRPLHVRPEDVQRLVGASLALNGRAEGSALERAGRLSRSLGFANSIRRSEWFARAIRLPELVDGNSFSGSARVLAAEHLDARSSALERNRALRELGDATAGAPRMVCNVQLFSEGVDVPALDAVVFFEPRNSQVDVVQAVGRVMRRSPDKRFGYIVVPVIVPPGQNVEDALEAGSEGYEALGRVLRALQAHDMRLAEDPARFVEVSETRLSGEQDDEGMPIQYVLDLERAVSGIFAHVVAASGLGKPGLLVSQEIEAVVRSAAAVLVDAGLADRLADALGLVADRGTCTIAALLLANACLLHRRLVDLESMTDLEGPDLAGRAVDPCAALQGVWGIILRQDYRPVFTPAVAVLNALPVDARVHDAVRALAECAGRVAESLSELGYDHAGPLYHRILGTAKSDGAFYTNNVSALMLARLALSEGMVDWRDPNVVAGLRIMDPACGTGTLLMATMQTIKSRARVSYGAVSKGENSNDSKENEERESALHRDLVEQVLCGLDINHHAIQLAACNLTLGAPNVDYRRMNLLAMRHGPDEDGTVKVGSLELLDMVNQENALDRMTRRLRTLNTSDARQIDRAEHISFPLRNLDMIIMNPPFTSNLHRGRQFGPEVVKKMQKRELDIRDHVAEFDHAAGSVIHSNSIGTFFIPLADQLLRADNGVLAMVAPVMAWTGTSGLAERRFLADRFFVERIVASHDPKQINFSENTSIHETLVVLRRSSFVLGGGSPATEFVSLTRMPVDATQAIKATDAIVNGDPSEWGKVYRWPADRVIAGDWTPVQWCDGGLAEAAHELERPGLLEPVGLRHAIGPAGRRIYDAYQPCAAEESGAVLIFHSASGQLRRTMQGVPEAWHHPKPGKESLAESYWAQRSQLLVATRVNTVSGRLTALWTPQPSVGSGWVPVTVENEHNAKALAAWWNATPARLMLLNRRGKTLTYPKWSLALLREIRIPKPSNPAWNTLKQAFDLTCDKELLPMKQAEECDVRRVIDEAAAEACALDPQVVADWRRRLACEPTISNRRVED